MATVRPSRVSWPMCDVEGVLRGPRLVTLVWEGPERAFGLQVRGMPSGEEVALRVARSIRPDAAR